MKKLILLLITLTTLTNVSYASFPVSETEPTEYVEESKNKIELPNYDYSWLYSVSSALLAVLGWFSVFALIGGAMGGSPDSALNTIQIFFFIFNIGAIILGITSFVKKSKGYFLGILGALSGIILLLIALING